MLRRTAIKVVRHLGIVGECNIQYALHPESERYCIIEVNARLSRSSALASKATGYPLAYVATKLSLGKDLVSIRNSVTKTTTACFEPSLDYCVVKMPRWDLKKFSLVSNQLGSSMLSVGEVMAVGRTFEETIQKACRMVNPTLDGLEGEDSRLIEDSIPLEDQLKLATDTRLFAVQTAIERGWSIDKVFDLTKIDRWFLSKLYNIAAMRKACKTIGSLEKLVSENGRDRMRSLKMAGFSDKQVRSPVLPTCFNVVLIGLTISFSFCLDCTICWLAFWRKRGDECSRAAQNAGCHTCRKTNRYLGSGVPCPNKLLIPYIFGRL